MSLLTPLHYRLKKISGSCLVRKLLEKVATFPRISYFKAKVVKESHRLVPTTELYHRELMHNAEIENGQFLIAVVYR